MSDMGIPQARYRNTSGRKISFEVATVPCGPMVKYDLGPDEEFDGPVAYKAFFARHQCRQVDEKPPSGAVAPPPVAPAKGPAKAASEEAAKSNQPELWGANEGASAPEPKGVPMPKARSKKGG